MSRIIDLVVAPERTDGIIASVRRIDGVLGIKLFRGASIEPAGDVLSFQATNEAAVTILREVMGDDEPPASFETQEPKSHVSDAGTQRLDREGNDALWEEIASLLRKESNPLLNFIVLMLLAGAIAAVGLWTDTIHVLIGAMVLAPGFHPILRLPLGFISGPRYTAKAGGIAVLAGYTAIVVGAAATTAILFAVTPAASTNLDTRFWVGFFSTITGTAVLTSIAAAAAGAVTVAADRSVLAAGAMIGLALVPSASLVGMAAVTGEPGVLGGAAARWALDVALVAGVGGLVLVAKQKTLHRRPAAG